MLVSPVRLTHHLAANDSNHDYNYKTKHTSETFPENQFVIFFLKMFYLCILLDLVHYYLGPQH